MLDALESMLPYISPTAKTSFAQPNVTRAVEITRSALWYHHQDQKMSVHLLLKFEYVGISTSMCGQHNMLGMSVNVSDSVRKIMCANHVCYAINIMLCEKDSVSDHKQMYMQ